MEFLKSISAMNLLGWGSIAALVGGSLFSWAKNLPYRVQGLIVDWLTVRVDIRDTDPLFPALQSFFHKDEFMKRCRRLLVQCKRSSERGVYGYASADLNVKELRSGVLFSRAPGKHFLWYRNNLVVFVRSVDDKKTAVGRPVETITLRTFGRQDKILKELLTAAKGEAENREIDKLIVLTSAPGGEWKIISGVGKRGLDTVILAEGKLENIVSDLEGFFSKKDFYARTGTPHHRGYLLFGPPGGGKSSLVRALSTKFEANLYVLNLNEIRGDGDLRKLFREVNSGSFVLIEDIDTVLSSVGTRSAPGTEEIKTTEDPKNLLTGVTLGGLLNVLDGVFSAEDLVVFLTTNHPEKLDSALMRAGRVDKKVMLDYADFYQAKQLYKKFYQEAPDDLAEAFAVQTEAKNISMAELQEQLVAKFLKEEE
jgi:chaperone BCS1